MIENKRSYPKNSAIITPVMLLYRDLIYFSASIIVFEMIIIPILTINRKNFFSTTVQRTFQINFKTFIELFHIYLRKIAERFTTASKYSLNVSKMLVYIY